MNLTYHKQTVADGHAHLVSSPDHNASRRKVYRVPVPFAVGCGSLRTRLEFDRQDDLPRFSVGV